MSIPINDEDKEVIRNVVRDYVPPRFDNFLNLWGIFKTGPDGREHMLYTNRSSEGLSGFFRSQEEATRMRTAWLKWHLYQNPRQAGGAVQTLGSRTGVLQVLGVDVPLSVNPPRFWRGECKIGDIDLALFREISEHFRIRRITLQDIQHWAEIQLPVDVDQDDSESDYDEDL